MYTDRLDRFCGSRFWDSNLSWHTSTTPDLTLCFEKTILIWVPCLIVWIFCPLQLYFLVNRKYKKSAQSFINKMKLIGMVLLCIFSTFDIVYAIVRYSSGMAIFSVDFVTPFLKLITFGLVIALTIANRTRGINSSGLVFLFWLCLAFCGIFQYQSEIRLIWSDLTKLTFSFASYMVYYPLVLVELFLNFFDGADPKPLEYPPVKKPCPEMKASYPSRIVYLWFNKLILTAYERPLKTNDLWDMNYEDSTQEVVPLFNKYWERLFKAKSIEKESYVKYTSDGSIEMSHTECTGTAQYCKNKNKASILPVLWKSFGHTLLFGAFLKLIENCLVFFIPQILQYLISFIENTEEPLWRGIFYAFLLMFVLTSQTIILSQYYHRSLLVGMRIRTALNSAIYRKALKMSNRARTNISVGEIVNLMAVDAHRFVDISPSINMIWSAPLQIVLAIYFLWHLIGPSVLAGLFVMILLIPVNCFMAAKKKKLQTKQMQSRDQRVNLINEIFSGIKLIKLNAWEPIFEKEVLNIRCREISLLRSTAYWTAITSVIWACAPLLVSLVSFAVYVFCDDSHVLDAQTAFVSLYLFNILRVPFSTLPMFISNFVEVYVSIKRIDTYMNSEELDPDSVTHDLDENDPLVIENGTFTWGDPSKAPILKNINVRILPGQLVAVVGSVGAGKSSLLSAFLGEMNKVSGRVNTFGSIAYLPQQAWIQNTTFKNNILFNQPLNSRAYSNVIEACALEDDLVTFPKRDQTEVGEKGINLNEGEKQRISLARAIYKDSDIYFLDDPLSAVDAHVGRHIFDRVIGPTGLLSKKTRIFVTQCVTYLQEMDVIFVLKDGEISEFGTYKQLIKKESDFVEFLSLLKNEQNNVKEVNKNKKDEPLNLRKKYGHQRNKSGFNFIIKQKSIDSKKPTLLPNVEKQAQLVKEGIGSVKREVYVYYIKLIGPFLCITIVLFSIISQGFSMSSNIWLSVWSNDNSSHVINTLNIEKKNTYVLFYGLLGLFQGISLGMATILLMISTVKASEKIFILINTHMFKNPVSLFKTKSTGSILNIVSKDIDTIDNVLPCSLRIAINTTCLVIGILVVISYNTPVFAITIVPIGVIYFYIQRFYVATSRQLKRLESVTRSPIYSHFSETVTGVESIRAYGMQSKFTLQCEKKVDCNNKCYYPSIVATRWLAVRLETIGNLIIFFASIFSVLGRDTLNPGTVGLSICCALQITQGLNWMVRMASEIETNIVALEQVKKYLQTPQEAPWEIPSNMPPQEWPSTGEVIFRNLNMRYRDGLELVLKDISTYVEGGNKIGIVGHTGSGKSSLILCLFRIFEAAAGSIMIDGIDIAKIGLHTLRSRLTIIPQDPILFSGTLRKNLDPTNSCTDVQLWNALKLVRLKTYFSGRTGGLHQRVSERENNLSVGQKQLLCLARAFLKKTKVLVFDEATSSIDLETDDLIQFTIKSEFKDCTILTIAHRLDTIKDSDKIMVMDEGFVVEYDTPANLLQDRFSTFYQLTRTSELDKSSGCP